MKITKVWKIVFGLINFILGFLLVNLIISFIFLSGLYVKQIIDGEIQFEIVQPLLGLFVFAGFSVIFIFLCHAIGKIGEKLDIPQLVGWRFKDMFKGTVTNASKEDVQGIDKNNQELLIEIWKFAKDCDSRLIALEKIDNHDDFLDYNKIALYDRHAPIRLMAVDKVSNKIALKTIALKDKDNKVRLAAFKKIDDQSDLVEILLHLAKKFNYVDEYIEAAEEKINNKKFITELLKNINKTSINMKTFWEKIDSPELFHDIALNAKNKNLRGKALDNIMDLEIIKQIALKDIACDIRLNALEKIDDQKIIAEIALKDKDDHVRKCAVWLLNDQDILAEIAQHNNSNDLRKEAIKKLDKSSIIEKIIRTDKNINIRKAALYQIKDINVLSDIAENDADIEIRSRSLRLVKEERPDLVELFINEIVDILVSIYSEKPEGFLMDRKGALENKIRVIGKQLDFMGGFEAMREAHRIFSLKCPNISGASRNLEMMWNGIGGWRG